MISSVRGVRISGWGSCLPQRQVSNAEVIGDFLDTSDSWVRQNLGIESRHIADHDSETNAYLAAEACREAIRVAGISIGQVDGLIVATATPDQNAPSTACLVQAQLGMSHGAPAFDVNAVCSGFLFSLSIAGALMANSDARNILVVGVDSFSKITDWTSRDAVYFGDGAGAVCLGRSDLDDDFLATVIYSDGSGHQGFYVPPSQGTFVMSPRDVYDAATQRLPAAVKELLRQCQLSIDDVGLVVPHQPSLRALDSFADSIGISRERVVKSMSLLGNTAGASIPTALDFASNTSRMNEGDLILFAAVGSGWTWGAGLTRWAGK